MTEVSGTSLEIGIALFGFIKLLRFHSQTKSYIVQHGFANKGFNKKVVRALEKSEWLKQKSNIFFSCESCRSEVLSVTVN